MSDGRINLVGTPKVLFHVVYPDDPHPWAYKTTGNPSADDARAKKELYALLKERDPYQSISHKSMPEWSEHCAFVDSRPYDVWWLIMYGGLKLENGVDAGYDIAGSIYLTKAREIGISVYKKYHRRGIATKAIKQFMDMHPGRFLANINPSNEASIKLFAGLGFTHIQNTYAHE